MMTADRSVSSRPILLVIDSMWPLPALCRIRMLIGTETKPCSLEEVGSMLNVLPEASATAVATAAFTGLRLGELRGLTWEAYEPRAGICWHGFRRGLASNLNLA